MKWFDFDTGQGRVPKSEKIGTGGIPLRTDLGVGWVFSFRRIGSETETHTLWVSTAGNSQLSLRKVAGEKIRFIDPAQTPVTRCDLTHKSPYSKEKTQIVR